MNISNKFLPYLFLLILFNSSYPSSANPSDVLSLTSGRHVRIAFLRGVENKKSENVRWVMGWDTYSGVERKLLPTTNKTVSFVRLTPDGQNVIFTNKYIYKLNWNTGDTSLLKKVNAGAIATWRNPDNGQDYVYYVESKTTTKSNGLFRFTIDNPNHVDTIWTKNVLGKDSLFIGIFTISGNGKYIGGDFGWPDMGVAESFNGNFFKMCDCCSGNISPDNNYYTLHYWGDHKRVYIDSGLVNGNQTEIGQPDLALADSIKYRHPYLNSHYVRWTNDPKILVDVGPSTDGETESLESVRLFKLSDDYKRVDDMLYITDTSRTSGDENRVDVWIAPHYNIKSNKNSFFFFSDSSDTQLLVLETPIPLKSEDLNVSFDTQYLNVTLLNSDNNHFTYSIKALFGNKQSGVYYSRIIFKTSNCVLPIEVKITIKGSLFAQKIEILPSTKDIEIGEKFTFKVISTDQFGNDIKIPINWSTSGGGTINSDGSFASDSTEGAFTITASSETDKSLSAIAIINVKNGILLDTGFIKNFLHLVDYNNNGYLTQEDSSLIESSFSKTYPSPGYRISDNNKNEFTWISQSNNEGHWDKQSGKKKFLSYWNINIINPEDKHVLLKSYHDDHLHIWHNKNLIKIDSGKTNYTSRSLPLFLKKGSNNFIFRLTQLDGGSYFAAKFTDTLGQILNNLRYLSVVEPDESIIHIVNPNNKAEFKPGDTLNIIWNAIQNRIDGVQIKVSLGNDKLLHNLTPLSAITFDNPLWGHFPWVIPDEIPGFDLLGKILCRVKINAYTFPYYDISDEYFTIDYDKSNTIKKHSRNSKDNFSIFKQSGYFHINNSKNLNYELFIYNINGVEIKKIVNNSSISLDLKNLLKSNGLFLFYIRIHNSNLVFKYNIIN